MRGSRSDRGGSQEIPVMQGPNWVLRVVPTRDEGLCRLRARLRFVDAYDPVSKRSVTGRLPKSDQATEARNRSEKARRSAGNAGAQV
jgi:hypothetical protein